jgi:hypothetical protein
MTATNQSKDVSKKVLVTAASGLLGVAAIEKFSCRGLGGGWRLAPEARAAERPQDRLSIGRFAGRGKTRAAFEPLGDVTHIAYTALHENVGIHCDQLNRARHQYADVVIDVDRLACRRVHEWGERIVPDKQRIWLDRIAMRMKLQPPQAAA